jgi:hypothetical protein
VATTPDYTTARELAFALNQGDLDIHGHFEALEVESRVGQDIRLVAEIPLSKAGWFG